ncbi:hypothetical protein V8C86DRAFT_272125 [Haematococcus lacustris]
MRPILACALGLCATEALCMHCYEPGWHNSSRGSSMHACHCKREALTLAKLRNTCSMAACIYMDQACIHAGFLVSV